MGIKVLEGKWEDVSGKVKLAGKRVKIIYPDSVTSEVIVVELTDSKERREKLDQASLLKQLLTAKGCTGPALPIDLDRDRLFGELHG